MQASKHFLYVRRLGFHTRTFLDAKPAVFFPCAEENGGGGRKVHRRTTLQKLSEELNVLKDIVWHILVITVLVNLSP